MTYSYNDPRNPEHINWLIARRERFCKIVREGKRVCRLLPLERELAIQLCKLVEAETKKLKAGNRQ